MSNVVHLNITSRNAREGGRLAQLLAAERRYDELAQ